MAQAASEGAVFTYKVTADARGNYLQMFRPQTTKLLKSLQIPQEQLPEVRAGEAWIETNGNEVLCCIPLDAGLLAGHVTGVSQKGIKVKTETGKVANFPMQWGPAMSQVKLYDSVKVNIKTLKLYVMPGDGNPPSQKVPQNQLNPQVVATVPNVMQSMTILPSGQHPQQESTASLPSSSTPYIQPSHPLPQHDIEINDLMKAEFHRPSEEDFERRTQEIAKTIGRHRLPIQSLQWEFKWNPLMVQKFQMLNQPYSAWRRSRGDGNCFYRCLGVLLLEHYCRPDTPLPQFFELLSEMINQNRHFALTLANEHDLGTFKLFAKLFKDLYHKRVKGEETFQYLQYCLQRQNVDKAMIRVMRKYTASYLQMNCQHPDLAPFLLDLPALIAEITEYGKEAEGLALIAAARCFSVVLRILTVDNKSADITETVYGPELQGWYPSFSLLHLPGHYNYLIRSELQEADHYDFASNYYYPIPTGRIIGYEQFPRNS